MRGSPQVPGARLLPTLYGVAAVLAVVVLAPLLRPGYLLYRDAVSTPRSHVTDAALGVGDLAPRAVPQDWLVAVASSALDGGVVVISIVVAACVFGAVGYGRLAARLVPAAGRTGAIGAAAVSVWNPFVAERLLQGHWALLVGVAALGWVIVAVIDVAARPRSATRWLQLGALLAVAGLTPTGSLLAGVVAVLTAAVLGLRLLPGVVALWVVSSLPWVTAAIVGGAPIGSDGAAGVTAFSLRVEPYLGAVGTALGLGGIWNSAAVPASRSSWWAAVATACLITVVAAGAIALWRSRAANTTADRRVVVVLAALAAVTVVVVAASGSAPGRSVLAWLVDSVPGAGLLRDSQKFLALMIPCICLAVAAATRWLHRLVPSGFALALVALLVVAPLPDLAGGVGGKLASVRYPSGWSAAASAITADSGAVALWPSDTVRHYDFSNTVSLDPAARMFAAPVVESGELRVDGRVVDPATPVAEHVDAVLAAGGDPDALADLGIGWVLVERTADAAVPIPAALAHIAPVVDQSGLILFQIPGASTPHASTAARVTGWSAHLVWLMLIASGGLAGVSGVLARRVASRLPDRHRMHG